MDSRLRGNDNINREDNMKIDAHNHLGGPDKGDGKSQSPEEILRAMDAAGIDMAVVFPFNEAEPGVSFSRCNDFIADAARAHPDRLVGFCRLDPNFGERAVKELERCVKGLGLKGVKLHPSSQGFALDDPVLLEILAAAEGFGMPVVLDTGKKESPPSSVATLAEMFQSLTIIMAHINLLEESLKAASGHPNIYLGTTGYFNIKRLGEAVKTAGAHRFVSGSDSPYIKMEREVGKFDGIPGLSDQDKALITGGNAASVLELDN